MQRDSAGPGGLNVRPDHGNPGRARAWGARAFLLVLAGAVAVVAAEAGLRLFGFAPPPGLFTVSEREFQRVPGIFQPNQRALEQQGTEFEHFATIDSLGYRGGNFPRAKPPGELRVLYAGDSFTWGHNVGDDETLPAQLQERLREQCRAARVINAGLSGSTIVGQDEIIVRGLTLDPDVVILMFHENDIDELTGIPIWEQLAENRRMKSRFPLSVVYPLMREGTIWNLALNIRRARSARAGPVVQQGARRVDPAAEAGVERARRLYAERLAALVDLLDEKGTPILFVAFPHPESVRAGAGGPHYDWVLEIAGSLAIPTVDLLETLLEVGEPVEDTYLLPLDYHPNPRGHGIAAQRVGEFLLQDPRLGSCETSRTLAPEP